MSSKAVQPKVEPRTLRAATEHMSVIEEARSLFSVTTESGSEYMVDLREPACTCPDFRHRVEAEECKHVRRCRIEFGQVDTDRLRDQIAETADDLEANAEKLESKAQELTKAATELRNALERLEQVSQ